MSEATSYDSDANSSYSEATNNESEATGYDLHDFNDVTGFMMISNDGMMILNDVGVIWGGIWDEFGMCVGMFLG